MEAVILSLFHYFAGYRTAGFVLLLLIILLEFCVDQIFAYLLKIECSLIRNTNFYSYNFLQLFSSTKIKFTQTKPAVQ